MYCTEFISRVRCCNIVANPIIESILLHTFGRLFIQPYDDEKIKFEMKKKRNEPVYETHERK